MSARFGEPLSPETLRPAAMLALRIDRDTATIVREMRAAQLACLLLKGPSTANWLYPGELRPYTDIDLMVPPSGLVEIEAVLRDLGYVRLTGGRSALALHAESWGADDDRPPIDLHTTIRGVRVPPETVWTEFSGNSDELTIAGCAVPVPRLSVRALHVALHAVQHGPDVHKPQEDLRRAIERGDLALWRDAADAAERLGVVDRLAGALRQYPAGGVLADQLELRTTLPRAVAVSTSSTPTPVRSLAKALEHPNRRVTLARVVRTLVPSPRAMRRRYPLARRGRFWLAASYIQRPLMMLARLPAAAFAYWRAGR